MEGFWRIPYYNQRITGVSVDGLVSGVERDKVQVDMELETGGNPQDRYWFPFSTVASSADGSGWYCMPEPGESVRVFFPVDDEKEGYVITNIKGHNPQNAGTEDPMGNPANRSITTEQGNQVQFTEMGVMIAAGEGAGSILLNKDGSVVVEGLKDMVLDAGEEIRLSAGEAVTLKSQTAIRIINEAGADVKVRGKSIWLHGQLIVENT